MIAAGGEGCAYKFKADTSQEDQVDKLFNFVLEKFGGIDSLILLCHVLAHQQGGGHSARRMAALHCRQPRRRVPHQPPGWATTGSRRARRGGHILNFASQAAFKGSTTFHAHYAAAKAGVVACTVSFAKEVAKEGIYVNSIAPGMTATVGKGVAHRGKGRATTRPASPWGASATPEEMADIVAFLVSPKNSYMIGATVDVFGRHALSAERNTQGTLLFFLSERR